MLAVLPITLADERVRLEPLGLQHVDGLKRAAADGELWTIRVTSVPEPDDTRGYVERALQGFAQGHRLAFAVVDARTGDVIGSSSYHDIVPAVERLEIGYTWYAKSRQGTHVNASAKLLLRSEEHTSELQSRPHLVCRLLLDKTDAAPRAVVRLHPVCYSFKSLLAPG